MTETNVTQLNSDLELVETSSAVGKRYVLRHLRSGEQSQVFKTSEAAVNAFVTGEADFSGTGREA